VTQLIDPPRIVQLRKRHDDAIEIDVSDMIWAILGTAVHKVLETGGDETHLPEERLFARVAGWDVSGAVDLQVIERMTHSTAVDIVDYKNTSVWSIIYGKPDWEAQLNCYAWLVRQVKTYTVRNLRVVAFLRDWNRRDATQNRDYPRTAAVEIDIPLWSVARQTEYIDRRVRLHQQAEMAAVFDDTLPECTEEEQWTRNTVWIVTRDGRRAYRVFPDDPQGEKEAKALALRMNAKGGKPYDTVRRIGHRNRCEGNFCRVAPFCEQWAKASAIDMADEV
jgi:hypothetical protein